MPLTIKYDYSAVQAHLQELQKRLGDLSPAMDAIAYSIEQNVRKRYETRTDPTGKKWDPWKKSTQESYPWPGSQAAVKDGTGRGMLLERYGAMFDGLSSSSDSTSSIIGFDQPYAAYHEWGTKKMVRRGLLTANPDTAQLGEADKATVLEVIEEFFDF